MEIFEEPTHQHHKGEVGEAATTNSQSNDKLNELNSK